MKQNITLSLDKGLIKKAKILAAQKDTSITRMLGEELKQLVDKDEKYRRAMRKALAHLNTGFHLGGKITTTREELHER